jgi:Domain of unknown function (DUF1816)
LSKLDNNSLGWLTGLTGLFNQLTSDWWVEVTTQQPKCTYYFGPFPTAGDAEQARPGYIEDLQQEGAQEIISEVKRCKPKHLTITDEIPVSSSST